MRVTQTFPLAALLLCIAGCDPSTSAGCACTPAQVCDPLSGQCVAKPPPDLTGIWGSDANHVWAVGQGGLILFWSGAAWEVQDSGTQADLTGVWGANASHVWAVGGGGTILFWNGAVWAPQASGVTGGLAAIWGAGAGDVWAVGPIGTALHFDGAAWTPRQAGLPATSYGMFRSLWGSGSNDVWGSTTGSTSSADILYRWNGAAWAVDPSVSGDAQILAIWGSSGDDVWAVGLNSMYWHFTPATAYPYYTQVGRSPYNANLNGVWGSGAGGHVFAVGDYATIAEWNGSAWSAQALQVSTDLRAVWGSAVDHVWAVGSHQTIVFWNGLSWTPVSSPR